MGKLKLAMISDEKPTKITIEIPATVHRDLTAYSEALAQETGGSPIEPARLIVPMIVRFIATDREFAKAKRRQ